MNSRTWKVWDRLKSGGRLNAFQTKQRRPPRKAAATTTELRREFEFGFFLGGVLWFFLAVEEVGKFKAEIAGVGGVGKAGIGVNDTITDELFDFAVEMLHAFGVAVA